MECESFINIFKVPEQLYNAAYTQVIGQTTPKILGNVSDRLPSLYSPSSYLNSSTDSSHVYTIATGKKWETTFKIDTGDYVFSCLFDSGTEITCMNMDTVATLGLMSKMVDSSITVNTASGQNMGVAGDVYVSFKIGRAYSFTHRFVVCECLSRPFILGDDFMSKHYMNLGWAPGKKEH